MRPNIDFCVYKIYSDLKGHEESQGLLTILHEECTRLQGVIESLVDTNEDLAKELEAASLLLKRISQWDHMDTAGDGPYWRKEIKAQLGG